jgi:hypothetical protein
MTRASSFILAFAAGLLLWPIAAGTAQAQDFATGSEPSEVHGVIAQGHAEIKAKPDIAYIEISRIDQSQDQAAAVRSNATAATSVFDQLKQSGIPEADIQTEVYGVEPQYDYRASPPVLTGYQVTNTMRVTVRDLTKTGLVIDLAIKAGASRIDGVTFDLADRARTEQAALVQAVGIACAKAKAMADAAGIDLGRLISLQESGPGYVAPQPLFAPRVMEAGAMAQAPTPITPQQIVVSADVTVNYEVGSVKQQ